MRDSRLASGLLALALACGLTLQSSESQALINGSEDDTGTYSAVARFGGGCSAVLVAPRVMLTSAHCLPFHALQCTNLTMTPLSVTFAETGGGWSSSASFNARTVDVGAFVQGSQLFDLSQCSNTDMFNCGNYNRAIVNHSRELVVMYLDADAPIDVTPLPLLINPNVDSTYSAAEVGFLSDLEGWVDNQDPVATTVGYGIGSHGYMLGATVFRGRDYGLQRLVDTESDYTSLLGATSCNQLAAVSDQPGVWVSPEDLDFNQLPVDGDGNPDLSAVMPGADFSPSQHSQSGTGDSGGPVLVGNGIGARGDFPTSLGTALGSFDANRNYIAGTASLWATFQGDPGTVFTPTWTYSASTFLMDLLHDSDGDGFADPVDDDMDGDECDNDVDQHPEDRWVPVGRIYYPNCSPSEADLLGDEKIDTDGDGVRDCQDTNDDNDALPDDLDPCPVDDPDLCIELGPSCPWNPIFFDCILAGCNDLLLKLSSLVNPDPAEEVFFPVLSVADWVVVVAPPPSLSLEESVAALAGDAFGRRDPVAELLMLEVVGPEGVRGILAAFNPDLVVVGTLEGANALQLRFGDDGRSLEINGIVVEAVPTRGMIFWLALVLALATTAAWWLRSHGPRLDPGREQPL